MSNQPTPDPTAQPLRDLEQPLQELRTEEAEEVSGGITRFNKRPKRAEAVSDDDSNDNLTLSP